MSDTKPKIWLRDNLILKWDWLCGPNKSQKETMLLIIHQDDDPDNPRSEYDHMAEMALFHDRYVLGDSHWQGKKPEDFWEALIYGGKDRKHVITQEEIEKRIMAGELPWFMPDLEEDMLPVEQLCERIIGGKYNWGILTLSEKAFITPVYLYDHSGISISMNGTYPYNDQFDSCTIGWCMVTKEAAINMGATEEDWKEKAKACVESEIKEYDHYLRGDSWWYQLKRLEDGEWEDYEACAGFIGDTLEDSGIEDSIEAGLQEALASGTYQEGTAEARQVTVWEYKFN